MTARLYRSRRHSVCRRRRPVDPAALRLHPLELHRLENEGDDIYQRAVGGLFHETRDPLEVIKWKDVYEKLEETIDRCEQVANIIEGVIIKHS